MRRELFVWWRGDPAQAEAVAPALHAWHARLRRQHPGLDAVLFRRQQIGVPHVTWMEHYRCEAEAGIGIDLQAQIEHEAAALLQAFGAPARHAEVFERLPG